MWNEQSYELELQAKKIDLYQEVDSHQACNKSLLDKLHLTEEAR